MKKILIFVNVLPLLVKKAIELWQIIEETTKEVKEQKNAK